MATINYNPNAFGTTSTLPSVGGNPNAGYNANPSPQGGNGPFGSVPGAIGIPNPFANLAAVYPGLATTNQGASGDILSNLTGTLSPDTLNQLQTNSAQNAFVSGMPGSPFANNAELASVASASQGEQQQGVGQYNQTIPGVTSTQTTEPSIIAEIAMQNALNASAPNPTLAGISNILGGIGGYAAGGGLNNIASWFGGSGTGPSSTYGFPGYTYGDSGTDVSTIGSDVGDFDE